MRRLPNILLWSISALAWVSAISFAAPVHWLAEIAANFRVQLALAAACLLLAALAGRFAVHALLALALLTLNGAPLLTYIAPARPSAAPPAADGARLRLVSVNLHNWSTGANQVLGMAQAVDADIIVVTEIAATHYPAFAALRAGMPFQTPDNPRDGSAFDIRLISRHAFAGVTVHHPEGPDFPVIEARLCPPQWRRCLRLIALHAPRPAGDGRRDRMLAFAGQLAGQASGDWTVLAGDLNVTPFSPAFAQLLARSELRDSMVGQGLQSSWLARFLPLGLTLDHVLIDPGLAVIERSRGPSFGSDHFPVIVDLRPD